MSCSVCHGSGRIYEHVQDDTGIPCGCQIRPTPIPAENDIRIADFFKKYPWMQTLPKRVQDFFVHAECAVDRNGHQQYEYADNFRYAAFTDLKALAEFQMRHHKGCCGNREEIIEDDDGKLWVVGFNYGH